MDRQTIETALDAGKLRVLLGNGKYQTARRNGMTKTWKTRPLDFHIPIKYGFRGTGYLDHDTPANEVLFVD